MTSIPFDELVKNPDKYRKPVYSSDADYRPGMSIAEVLGVQPVDDAEKIRKAGRRRFTVLRRGGAGCPE